MQRHVVFTETAASKPKPPKGKWRKELKPTGTLKLQSAPATSMADRSSSPNGGQHAAPHSATANHHQFFVWREFLWGAVAGSFGEGIMHPVDTVKTRIQSQAILGGIQNIFTVGFYRGIGPGVTGSIATGATYFGFIESSKKWIEESNPDLGGRWCHFLAGALGDTLGSFVYVPCEVMKQRMQVQGTKSSWISVVQKDRVALKSNAPMYGYYNGMFQAGFSIWKEQGLRGLYAGYWSTLVRDVPFAGLMVVFYEALKDMTEYSKQMWVSESNFHLSNSVEGFLLGGLAGGIGAYLTTPLDVIKTRLQVQGSATRYNGWFDAIRSIWRVEGAKGMFRGSVPRITWYIPASALTFMAVEFLRDHFNEELDNNNVQEVSTLLIDKTESLTEVA